jgi:hypothetical protein
MARRRHFFLVVLLVSVLLAVEATRAQPLQPSGDPPIMDIIRVAAHWAKVGDGGSQAPKGLSLAPAIRVEPQSSTVEPGTVFTVEVQAGDVVDLGSFDFTLTFSPTVLSVQSATLGTFLGSTGRSTGALGPLIDNAAGSVRFGAFSFGTAAGPNGSGTLATLTLRALSSGSSPLHFASMQYTDTKIPVHTEVPDPSDGSVTVPYRVYLPVTLKPAQ